MRTAPANLWGRGGAGEMNLASSDGDCRVQRLLLVQEPLCFITEHEERMGLAKVRELAYGEKDMISFVSQKV